MPFASVILKIGSRAGTFHPRTIQRFQVKEHLVSIYFDDLDTEKRGFIFRFAYIRHFLRRGGYQHYFPAAKNARLHRSTLTTKCNSLSIFFHFLIGNLDCYGYHPTIYPLYWQFHYISWPNRYIVATQVYTITDRYKRRELADERTEWNQFTVIRSHFFVFYFCLFWQRNQRASSPFFFLFFLFHFSIGRKRRLK